MGGFNGSTRLKTCDLYDPVKDIWINESNMNCRRATLGVGLLHNKIYAVGGYDGNYCYNNNSYKIYYLIKFIYFKEHVVLCQQNAMILLKKPGQ